MVVPGFGPAVLALPADASVPRPVLVATHGAGGSPEGACALWREMLNGAAFVACPRGTPMGWYPGSQPRAFFYRDHHALEREVLAVLDALHRVHGARIAAGPAAFAGFSQGATMGALALAKHGDKFSHLILVEGGFTEWNVAISQRFRQKGGARVLFACGRVGCAEPAKLSAYYLTRGQVPARVLYAPSAGHTPGGAVGQQVRDSLEWLFAGDPRWESTESP